MKLIKLEKLNWLNANQKDVLSVLTGAINKALHVMGNDVKKIEWFSSKAAEDNKSSKLKDAA